MVPDAQYVILLKHLQSYSEMLEKSMDLSVFANVLHKCDRDFRFRNWRNVRFLKKQAKRHRF